LTGDFEKAFESSIWPYQLYHHYLGNQCFQNLVYQWTMKRRPGIYSMLTGH